MIRRIVAALVFAASLSLASSAHAQTGTITSYVGAGVGLLNVTFRPYLVDFSTYKAHGPQATVVIGRHGQLTDRFSIGARGDVTFNAVHWRQSIPAESADLEYSVPFAMAINVVPECRVSRQVSLYADAGVGVGRARERRTSSTSSTYDYAAMRTTLSVGGGATISMTRKTDLFVHLGYARYQLFGYEVFNVSGAHVARITDLPRTTDLTVGVTKRF